MCLASKFAVNLIDYFRALFVAKYVSGQHVFCDLGVHGSSKRGIDGSCSSVEFSCGMYWGCTSLCWGGSPRLLFLVYVWLSCRAVVLANLISFLYREGRWGWVLLWLQAWGTRCMRWVCSGVLWGDVCLWGLLCGQTPMTGWPHSSV